MRLWTEPINQGTFQYWASSRFEIHYPLDLNHIYHGNSEFLHCIKLLQYNYNIFYFYIGNLDEKINFNALNNIIKHYFALSILYVETLRVENEPSIY